MQPTIKTLRQSGYKVRVIHTRNYKIVKKISGDHCEILARGGSTTIQITTPDKKYDAQGVAECSDKDNFSKKTGNFIAVGRALKELKEMMENDCISNEDFNNIG
jgi:hypothetical protein